MLWPSFRTDFRRVPGLRCSLAALGVLVFVPGCEEERNVGGPRAAQKPAEDHFIVGKRTREIKNAEPEVQAGKATVAVPKITSTDPITLPANAYVTIIGETSILHIQHALDLYYAETGAIPRTIPSLWQRSLDRTTSPCPCFLTTKSTATTRKRTRW